MKELQKFLLLCFLVLLYSPTLDAQSRQLAEQLAKALESKNEAAYLALVSPDPDKQHREHLFFKNVVSFPYQKVILRFPEESDKKLRMQVFFQADREARFESWLIETTTKENRLLIEQTRALSAVTGLYRLRINQNSIPVENLQFQHLNAKIRLQHGNLFLIEAGPQLAGLLFMGIGSFEFDPPDPTEKQQIFLFAKKPKLTTRLESFYIRGSALQLKKLFGDALTKPPKSDGNLFEKANDAYKSVDRSVYSVQIPFSEDLWFTQVSDTEIYSEMKTRLGTLIYQYTPGEAYDVMLAKKEKEQIISLYNSHGMTNPKEYPDEFKILSYNMNVNYDPGSNHLSAMTKVVISSTEDSSTRIIFRLNPELRVTKIQSDQGSLMYIQERKTSNLHVILNEALDRDKEVRLSFYYAGKIKPEQRRTEAIGIEQELRSEYHVPPTFLYSNQSSWYPQLVTRPYTKLEATLRVPGGYQAMTNGKRVKTEESDGHITYTYSCDQPVKYFSFFVGKLDGHFTLDSIVPIDVYYHTLDKTAATQYAKETDRILRFYSNRFGKYPYSSFTLVLRPLLEPGGHAPATMAIVNRVFQYFQKKFVDDPLFLPELPFFALAHEIAHQWWGQAVGWRTYRDQWLSEGFAQYAAWEFIRSEYGEARYRQLAETFMKWIDKKTYAGPLILGARLGHISEDPQAFAALLYNKGAYALSMLRLWMGSENFSKGLTEFYENYRYKKVSVEDFQEFMQRYSNEDLTPFFHQWLYGWEIPSVRWTSTIDHANGASLLKLQFQQRENDFYELNIPVQAKSKTGETFRKVVLLDAPFKEIALQLPFLPDSIELDPSREVLMKQERR